MANNSSDPRTRYADYTHMSVQDHLVSGSSLIVSLFKEVSDLIPNAGPLSQVLGVTSQLFEIVDQIKTNKEGCEHLVERILGFLKDIAEERNRLNVPIPASSSTGKRLYTLISKIEMIAKDAETWKTASRWDAFWYRDTVEAAIAKHERNLEASFSSFMVGALIQLGVQADASNTDKAPVSGAKYSSQTSLLFVHIFTGFVPGHLFHGLVVSEAAYDRGGARARCLEGTRDRVIAEFFRWVDDDDKPLCWLSGPAGYGKSAITQSIAELCVEKNMLAASFFFLRGAGARSNFRHFITTLAYHLTLALPEIKEAIESALRNDPRIPSLSTQQQLRKLIIDPLLAHAKEPSTRIVFIVDALDECNDREDMSEFILILAKVLSEQPLPVKWFLTSRGEEHIHRAFSNKTVAPSVNPVQLENFNAQEDIEKFLRTRFDQIMEERPRLFRDITTPWPSFSDFQALADKSNGLFIFAATLVNFVTDDKAPPDQKLISVLNMHAGLDPLYDQVLNDVPDIACFGRVLSALMLVYEQPSVAMLAELLQLSNQDVLHALMAIQSIINIPSDDNTPIQLNHTSLRDFLTDKRRSNHHFICPPAGHMTLATRCVNLLQQNLTQDFFPEHEVELYAAEYWPRHLVDYNNATMTPPELISGLKAFSSQQSIERWVNILIFWNNGEYTIIRLTGLIKNCKVRLSLAGSAREVTDQRTPQPDGPLTGARPDQCKTSGMFVECVPHALHSFEHV
ncbi:hypothetical protein HWV62_4337 [Athelia sp. TMB]|nr:hypothetical protein HWV62_4337 [Athelia sp. TMB]